jgi:ABC-type transport system involved in cytochrome bd biosynthesis fused ATPase/permease subunit
MVVGSGGVVVVLQKIFNYISIIAIVIVIILSYCLWNDRSGTDRMSKLNQQYREQIKSANNRIRELEAIGKAKDRTISNLEADKRRLGDTIKRLEELEQQSNNSIGTIEAGDRQDRVDLQRLREIINKDGKEK